MARLTKQQAEQYSRYTHAVFAELSAAEAAGKVPHKGNTFTLLSDLSSLARTAHYYDVARCNYELTPRQETRAANTDKKAEAIAEQLGLTLLTNGDPRGYAYKLLLPLTNAYNTWGGPEEGWGVPEL